MATSGLSIAGHRLNKRDKKGIIAAVLATGTWPDTPAGQLWGATVTVDKEVRRVLNRVLLRGKITDRSRSKLRDAFVGQAKALKRFKKARRK